MRPPSAWRPSLGLASATFKAGWAWLGTGDRWRRTSPGSRPTRPMGGLPAGAPRPTRRSSSEVRAHMPDRAPNSIFDVVIIGAGVVGSAIARELSRHELDLALVEAGPDVGAGTSKANTAILHTGFDAKP